MSSEREMTRVMRQRPDGSEPATGTKGQTGAEGTPARDTAADSLTARLEQNERPLGEVIGLSPRKPSAPDMDGPTQFARAIQSGKNIRPPQAPTGPFLGEAVGGTVPEGAQELDTFEVLRLMFVSLCQQHHQMGLQLEQMGLVLQTLEAERKK